MAPMWVSVITVTHLLVPKTAIFFTKMQAVVVK